MRTVFGQPELETIRQIRVAELDAEAQVRRAAQHERETWERDALRDAVRHSQLPVRGGQPTPDREVEPPADPDLPDSDPNVER